MPKRVARRHTRKRVRRWRVTHRVSRGGSDANKIDIVVSRYKENLDWLKEHENRHFNKVYIYNKGTTEVNCKDIFPHKDCQVITLPNVGVCDHTYLHHIVTNYDTLPEKGVTIFLTGSTGNLYYKKDTFNKILNKVVETHNTVFLTESSDIPVVEEFKEFVIEKYETSNIGNRNSTGGIQVTASIRPFGKWYESIFPGKRVFQKSYWGIFAASTEHIRSRPKAFYESLLHQVDKSKFQEASHFIERSWTSILDFPEYFYNKDGSKIAPNTQPVKKILIFMSDNRPLNNDINHADYNSLVTGINYEYSKKHGYNFLSYRPFLSGKEHDSLYNCIDPNTGEQRHASWSKLLSTEMALNEPYDYVVYIDSDCIFKDFNRRIEDFIKDHLDKHIIFLNDKPWNDNKPCAGFYICKVCDSTRSFIKKWYNYNLPSKNREHAWEQCALLKIYQESNVGIIDSWMFKEEPGQFLRHIANHEGHLRKPYFLDVINKLNINLNHNINSTCTKVFDTNTLTQKGGSTPPTFHIMIATAGRPRLHEMLNSLKTELVSGDAITIIFDGKNAKKNSTYNQDWIHGMKCTVNIIEQVPGLKHYGHHSLNKYMPLLQPKTTFIMMADDDDTYMPASFNDLRSKCTDPNTLYIAKLIQNNHPPIIPISPEIKKGYISKQSGIIPFNDSTKSKLGTSNYQGDFEYYNNLQSKVANIVYLDTVMYKMGVDEGEVKNANA